MKTIHFAVTLFFLNFLLIEILYSQNSEVSIDEVYSIDEGQGDIPLFGELVDAVFDNEGNLYLLDNGNNQIHVFDLDGRYTRSFGGEGRGPGEFLRGARSLELDIENRLIYVIDYPNGRIVGYNYERGEHYQTFNTRSTSLIPLNDLVLFGGELYLLGSHQRSDFMVHQLEAESGETAKSYGNFIDFDSFVHNSNGRMQLSQVHASSYGEKLLVGLAAPNRMKLFDEEMNVVLEHGDDLLPIPWETHMVMEHDSYESTFYSMSVNNQLLSEDLYLYQWNKIIDPEGPVIEFYLDVRDLKNGQLMNREAMDEHFIIGMSRLSDNQALLFLRDEEFAYSVHKLTIIS